MGNMSQLFSTESNYLALIAALLWNMLITQPIDVLRDWASISCIGDGFKAGKESLCNAAALSVAAAASTANSSCSFARRKLG